MNEILGKVIKSEMMSVYTGQKRIRNNRKSIAATVMASPDMFIHQSFDQQTYKMKKT